MSEPSRPGPDDHAHSFWADPEPAPEAVHPWWMHSRVFGLGVVTIVGTVLGLAGLTWAGSGGSELSAAEIAAKKAAPAGACTFTVENKSTTLDAVRARSLTMVAAVGHQIAAPDVQIARAIDVAMREQGAGSTKVVDALALLARDDSAAPSRLGTAELTSLGTPAALTCRFIPVALAVEKKGDLGLTKRADTVRKYVLDAFGKVPTSGYAKPAATAGGTAASRPKAAKAPAPAARTADPAAEGRVIDVQVAPQTTPRTGTAADDARARGWQLAHWLVARGEVLKLDSVAFDDHTWTAASAAGWQGVAPDAVTHNLDLVHIVVQGGG